MQESSPHYTVLARRFRPQTFEEVVGQQHIAQALRNAIRNGRVAHAYLFTGARGVGKTSMARILGKSLNCPHVEDGNPCNACEVCEGIASGHDVDVIEIDGASNRGIDDIRSLRANVNVRSMRTKYKLYIIDEVHMLTKEAFNALLKTLEEPPPNVKFVFCTTEPSKVPDTILSRCQRFDFAAIETDNIANRLRQIAEGEGVEVEPSALELVARRATGSMRDSQSLFDQLLAFGGETITDEDVHRLLGTASDDRLIALVDALVERRRDAALDLLNRALNEGVQLGELVDQLVHYLRDLMVLATGAENVALLGVSSANRERLTEQAGRWGMQTIVAALQILAETKTRMTRVGFGRALVELALVRVTLLEDLDRLDQLARELKAGGDGSSQQSRAADKSRPQPSAGGAPPQKKSPPVESRRAAAQAEVKSSEPATAKSEAEPGQVGELPPETAADVWSQMLGRMDDMLKSQLQGVQDVAISGPNQLDVVFPGSYHFSKSYCERPDVRARLEQLAGEVTGRPIKMTVRLGSEAADSSSRMTSPAAEDSAAASHNGEASAGAFVEEVKSIFGATIVKSETIRSDRET